MSGPEDGLKQFVLKQERGVRVKAEACLVGYNKTLTRHPPLLPSSTF